MKCGKVWISRMDDCGENKGGYFCQVYADENMDDEIDYFCIHPEDCDCRNDKEVDNFIREYANQYQQNNDFNNGLEENYEKFY